MKTPLSQMSEDELRQEMAHWADHVKSAAGWPSAYEAAKGCLAVEREAIRRGITIENPYPIMIDGVRKR